MQIGKHSVSLTFDDGPGPSTLPLLDVLRQAGWTATFFALGKNLVDCTELAMDIVRDGHVLGNHTYSHAREGQLSDGELLVEIERTDALIRNVYLKSGLPAPENIPLRLPYGITRDDRRLHVLDRIGRRHVGWTLLVDDWQRPAPSPDSLVHAMTRHVESQAAMGTPTVFCLHDGSRHGEERPATVEAVEKFLIWVRKL